MISIKLSRIAGDRRVTRKELTEVTGKSWPTIRALYNDTATTIDLATLDKLCKFLKCMPQDLIEYVPENDGNSD